VFFVVRDVSFVVCNAMRYSLIMAGGSGTRLWPMSRQELPKQLIPFIDGRSLLEIAYDRFDGLIPTEHRYVCAGQRHREVVVAGIPTLEASRFLGEPVGRDTLNAVGFGAAVLAAKDPEAVIGVFTSDHLIEPVEQFQEIVAAGFALVEQQPDTLLTFGIAPTGPATGYGYLELGDEMPGGARVVQQFHEKPRLEVAEQYFRDGPSRYLWNSGMFVWRAQTLLDCIRRYEPTVMDGLSEIAAAWGTSSQEAALERVFPTLKKTSVDFAVMEPASQDTSVRVVAIPMPLQWLDVGSWPSYAETRSRDDHGNAVAADNTLLDTTRNCLVASSNADHLIATLGCEDLIIIHTERATLVCRADQAENIKQLQQQVHERFGGRYT
jgi:mannose-1-phosphate guanylyltransferase